MSGIARKRRVAAGAGEIGLLLVFLAGCSSTAPKTPEQILQLRNPTELAIADFPGAGAILSGFDMIADADPGLAGERVLFGLELHRGGECRRWLLLLEACEALAFSAKNPPPIEVFTRNGVHKVPRTRCPVTVRLYAADGKFLEVSRVAVPWHSLLRGLVTACLLAKRVEVEGFKDIEYLGRKLSADQVRREITSGFRTLSAFLRLVRDNKLLSSILWQVVDKPSLFSVLIHGGVRLKISSKLNSAESLQRSFPTAAGAQKLRCFRIPLQILVNGTPALDVVLQVSDPVSPLRIHGGIVALAGIRPSNAKVRVRMRLLAARRVPR